MKFRIRDPKGNLKNIEIEATATIDALRELVTKEFNASSPKQVKLISKGKLLTDGTSISSTNLEDNDLIMILIMKSKEEKTKKNNADEEAHKADIDELVEEGFERQQAISALRRANWDMDLALQYLEDGLQEEGIEGNPLQAGAGGGTILTMSQEQIDNLGDDELEDAIDMAIEHFLTAPDFRQIREQIRNNPGSAAQFSEQIRTLNPAFHDLIMDNPEIVQEIIEGINEFTEEELEGIDMAEDGDDGEDGWEDIDEDGNPVAMGNEGSHLIICKPCSNQILDIDNLIGQAFGGGPVGEGDNPEDYEDIPDLDLTPEDEAQLEGVSHHSSKYSNLTFLARCSRIPKRRLYRSLSRM